MTAYPSLAKLDGIKFTFTDDEYNVTESLRCVVAIEPDYDTRILDECHDVYGEIVQARDCQSQRPGHFTGRARKVITRSETFWWQPPADMPTTSDAEAHRTITRLMEEGYNMIHVVAEDANGVQIGDTYLGGCDHEYGADISEEVRDMFTEIINQAWSPS